MPTLSISIHVYIYPSPSAPNSQVRFTARGFSVAGDHAGQQSSGYRWPFGPVALITPFNFPLEIPALQLMGALFMGNKPLLHVDRRQTAPSTAAPCAPCLPAHVMT